MIYRPAVAVHEAGHCILARHEGLASACVVLREDGTGDHEFQSEPLGIIDIDQVQLPRDRHLVESVCRVLLAGNLAQFRQYPGSLHSDGDDLKRARVLLMPFVEMDQQFDTNADVETYLDVLRREVRSTLAVESVWREVTALAQELLANGRLEGDEIVRVCEAANWSVPIPFTVIEP